MSVKVFMRLTPRFRAGYMEIQKLQNGVFVSFLLGWSVSSMQTWSHQAAFNALAALGFE